MNKWDVKVRRNSSGGISPHPHGWISGEVHTPFGIVSVYSQGDDDTYPHSSYRIILGGRLYCYSEDKQRAPRGLVAMAGRIARELAEGGETDD